MTSKSSTFYNPIFDGPNLANIENTAESLRTIDESGKAKQKSNQFFYIFIFSFILACVMCGLMVYSFYQLKVAESKPSGHCPYFTNPNPGTREDKGQYDTKFSINNDTGHAFKLDPNPYSSN